MLDQQLEILFFDAVRFFGTQRRGNEIKGNDGQGMAWAVLEYVQMLDARADPADIALLHHVLFACYLQIKRSVKDHIQLVAAVRMGKLDAVA